MNRIQRALAISALLISIAGFAPAAAAQNGCTETPFQSCSPNLGLVLPDAGAYVDDWNIPVNNNFSLLDRLLSGGVNLSQLNFLNGTIAGTVTFTGSNTYSALQTFSAGTTSSFFQSLSANPALSGLLRMANSDQTCWRNFANSGDLCFALNSSNQLLWPSDLLLGPPSALVQVNLSPQFNGQTTGNTFSIAGGRGAVNGGGVTIIGAPGIILSNGTGGGLVLSAGGGGGTANGAQAMLNGGAGGSSNGNGGAVIITGGTGGGASGSGGNLLLNGGAGSTLGGLQTNTQFTQYNNQPTVGNGIAAEYATANLASQAASIANTNWFTTVSAGLYRVSCYVIVTQAATTSSTLPACNVLWNDQNLIATLSQGVTATSTGNTTSTFAQGTAVISVKAASTIQYSTTGYVSTGATPMQYALHIRLEAL